MNTHTDPRTGAILCADHSPADAEPTPDAERRAWLFLHPGTTRIACERCQAELPAWRRRMIASGLPPKDMTGTVAL
jgi:hypothetical protein